MTVWTWRIIIAFVVITSVAHEVTTAPQGNAEDTNDNSLTNNVNNDTITDLMLLEESQYNKLYNLEVDLLEKLEKLISVVLGNTRQNGLDGKGSIFQNVVSSFKNNFQLIYPGTLWCGDKDKASNYNDLGLFYFTDRCCREHDHCDDFIDPGKARNGLKNSGLFPRFNCNCDMNLYNCFGRIDSLAANLAAFIYFDVYSPQCFSMEHPVVTCETKILGKCIKYKINQSEEKRLQWFDNPAYVSKKMINSLNFQP